MDEKPFSTVESIFATALGEMTLRVSKLEEERDRLRAHVVRQRIWIAECPACEANALIDDPASETSAAWFGERIEAAREEGRQEVRETAEYRAGAGLREAAEKTREWEKWRAEQRCNGGPDEPLDFSEESQWGEPVADVREYLRRELSDDARAPGEQGQSIAGHAPDGLVE